MLATLNMRRHSSRTQRYHRGRRIDRGKSDSRDRRDSRGRSDSRSGSDYRPRNNSPTRNNSHSRSSHSRSSSSITVTNDTYIVYDKNSGLHLRSFRDKQDAMNHREEVIKKYVRDSKYIWEVNKKTREEQIKIDPLYRETCRPLEEWDIKTELDIAKKRYGLRKRTIS